MKEFHVSKTGHDGQSGSLEAPLKTISAAAAIAQPGDCITVHQGTYRERVNPPRGGTSDTCRITYQSVPGDEVWIKGSEIVSSWEPVLGSVWKCKLSHAFFGDYNPYQETIAGDWFDDKGQVHHTGEVFIDGQAMHERCSLSEVLEPQFHPDAFCAEGQSLWVWCCETTADETIIFANFHSKDPNVSIVEISVRPTCFYPDAPGRNFITVRGFKMAHAATQWAAPTAEQIGLLGVHWSQGWIIENNLIRDSRCVGITLGKDRADGHNVWNNNRAADALGADVYNEFVQSSLQRGWSGDHIGHHIVRNNRIFNCGAAAIAGGQGAIFSEISNNHIYNIHVRREFSGEEMAGIKLHAPIDVTICDNQIHHVGYYGIWLDWMTQGTRVSRNIIFATETDVFVEVNHGPYLFDNNCFLSDTSLRVQSEGGAYVHNLIAGKVEVVIDDRATPYHFPHSTKIRGITQVGVGDDRYMNNILMHPNPLVDYETMPNPIFTSGNAVTKSCSCEIERGDNAYRIILKLASVKAVPTQRVCTPTLGRTQLCNLAYVNTDDSPLNFDTDFWGQVRSSDHPTAGPFANVSNSILLECSMR
jgi:hypothetical protein